MEEPIARVEIERLEDGTFSAIVISATEGEKEIRARTLETLFRELTMDLEFVAGEHGEGNGGPEFSAEEEFENLEFAEESGGW